MRRNDSRYARWLTMVGLNLTIVLAPFLVYWALVYRAHRETEIARNFRVLAEIERELDAELQQFGPMFRYVPSRSLSVLPALEEELHQAQRPLVEFGDLSVPDPRTPADQAGQAPRWHEITSAFLESLPSSERESKRRTLDRALRALEAARDRDEKAEAAARADRNTLKNLLQTPTCDKDCKNKQKKIFAKRSAHVDAREDRLKKALGLIRAVATIAKSTELESCCGADWKDFVNQEDDRLTANEVGRVLSAARSQTSHAKYLGSLRRNPRYRNIVIKPLEREVKCNEYAIIQSSISRDGKVELAECPATNGPTANDAKPLLKAELPFGDLLDLGSAAQAFSAVLLVDEHGRVLHAIGRGVPATISTLTPALLLSDDATTEKPRFEKKAATNTEDASTPKREPRDALPAQVPFTAAGTSYHAFIQQLRQDFHDTSAERNPLRIYLAGVVPASRMQASITQIRLTVLGLVIASLLIAASALPFLRIVFIGPTERLRSTDIYALLIGLLFGGGVIALTMASTISYRTGLHHLGQSVRETAKRMSEPFADEVRDLSGELTQRSAEATNVLECDPEDEPPLNRPEKPDPLLDWEVLMFLDSNGEMKGPVHNNRGYGFRRVPVTDREYFRRVHHGPSYWMDDKPFFIERIKARDTGVNLTVLSMPARGSCDIQVASIAKKLRTFWLRLLPPAHQFAVVDDVSGRVLYHSDDSRSLVENFYEESDQDSAALAAIAARRNYEGRLTYRSSPSVAASHPLKYVPWTLLVFAETTPLATVAFEAALVATLHLLAYVFLLVLALALAGQLVGRGCWEWAWPQRQLSTLYVRATVCVLAIGIAALLLIVHSPGWAGFAVAASVPPLLLSSLHVRLHGEASPGRRTADWIVIALSTLCIVAASLDDVVDLQALATYPTLLVAGLFTGAAWAWFAVAPGTVSSEVPHSALTGRYVVAVSSLLLVVAVLPAVALFWDAWAVSSGSLAMLDAESVGKREREIEHEYMREVRRVSLQTNETAVQRQARELSDGLERLRQPLCHGTQRDDTFGNSHVWSTCEASEPALPHRDSCETSGSAGMYATEWLIRQLPPYTGFAARLGAITKNACEDDVHWDTADTRGPSANHVHWRPRSEARVAPALAGIHSNIWVMPRPALSSGDGVTVGVLAFLSLLLLFGLLWFVRSIARNIVAVELPDASVRPRHIGHAMGRAVFVNDAAVESWNSVMSDPAKHDALEIRTWALHEATANAASDPIRQMLEESLPAAKYVIVRGFEDVLLDAGVRQRVLRILEDAVLVRNTPTIVESLIRQFSGLTQAAPADTPDHPASVANGDKKETASRERKEDTANGEKNEAPPSSLHMTAAEGMRWSRVLAELQEATLAKAGDTHDTKKPADVIDQECGWSDSLSGVAARVRKLPGVESMSPPELLREIARQAEPIYRLHWNLCSQRERIAMLHLADGHLANPSNLMVIPSLIRRGLVVREPQIRLVSETFAAFVRTAEPPERLLEWQREAEESTWMIIRAPLVLAIFVGVGFVAYTSRDALDTTVSVVGAVATGLPLLLRVAGSATGIRIRGEDVARA